MKLDPGRFAVAIATVWASAGLVCGLIYKAAPETYARAANFLLHTDIYQSTRILGWGELGLAVVAWWTLVALLTGASAALYNQRGGRTESVEARIR